MTLTVGTDAYDTLDNVRAYWAARSTGTEWADLPDATAEIYIRKATDWVDRNFFFIGDKASASQRLKWPRKFAEVDGYMLEDDVIPFQVEEATAIVADLFRQGTVDLEGVLTDDDAAIAMQKVDVITVQYDTARRLQGQDIPSHVFQLLRPLTRGSGGLARA